MGCWWMGAGLGSVWSSARLVLMEFMYELMHWESSLGSFWFAM